VQTVLAATVLASTVLAACGGSSAPTAATASSAASTATAASTGSTGSASGNTWPGDVCSVLDQSTVTDLIGVPITSAASPPTQKRLCEYSGTLPSQTKPVVLVSVHYYPDRSEWDIHMGNLPVRDKDHIAGLGSDAFKSSDGIWVLLDDGRLVIADVAYGVPDESARELALTKEILTHA
jgi:hypothetical protein